MTPPSPPEPAPAITSLVPAPEPIALVRATRAELPGAGLQVAGLTVLERAARQLRREGHHVICASTPEAPPPRPFFWPEGAEHVAVPDAPAADALARTRAAATVVPADEVRVHRRDGSGTRRVTDEASRAAAEDAVFAELLRGDLGIVARYLNKPVSFRVTRHVLCHLPITPNQVTLGAGLIALIGAALIASGNTTAMIVGFFLAHVQSILDGCDGELARVRFQQSPIGEWLDTIVDDGLNLTLALAMGTGLSRAYHQPEYFWGGVAAAGLLLLYNLIAYRELARQGEGGEVLKIKWWFTKGVDIKNVYARGGGRGPAGLLMALGRRDFFIFAWLLLALLGYPELNLIYILAIALGSATVAVIQVFWRRPT